MNSKRNIERSSGGRSGSGSRLLQRTFQFAVAFIVAGAANTEPVLEYTSIPAYGTSGNLYGQADGVTPSEYAVATYIRVEDGWWTKPYWSSPTVTIAADGSWSVDVTTGGNDIYATEFASFLIPQDVSPPLKSGGTALPSIPSAVASTSATRGPVQRIVEFAGREWVVKSGDFRLGPGPNWYSSAEQSVWSDGDGLHLTIRNRDDRWWCTEVILRESLGYGTYIITTTGRVDALDPRATLGIFTWDAAASDVYFRELDIVEHARWGDANLASTSQFVVQPCSVCPGCASCERFTVDLSNREADVTHFMNWRPGRVTFRAYYGNHTSIDPPEEDLISEWIVTEGVPEPGNENLRFNFWLLSGNAPLYGLGDEIVFTDFKYYGLANEVFVDFGFVGVETGATGSPFDSVGEAALAVEDGGDIIINGESSVTSTSETPTLDIWTTLKVSGGSVQIGAKGSQVSDGFGFKSRRRVQE